MQERETYLGESGHTWWCGAVGRERGSQEGDADGDAGAAGHEAD